MIRKKRRPGLAGERRGREAAAVNSAGTALGALGMLAFAVVFWLMVENDGLGAFIGASLAWLVVSVAAWYLQHEDEFESAESSQRNSGPAVSRSRYG